MKSFLLSIVVCLGLVGCSVKEPLPVTTQPEAESLSLDSVSRAVCRVTNISGSRGTGFFFKTEDDSKYYIMTSAHVVAGGIDKVMIEMSYTGKMSGGYFGMVQKIAWNIKPQNYFLESLLNHGNPVDVAVIVLDKFTDYPAPVELQLAPEGYKYKDELVKSFGYPRAQWATGWISYSTKEDGFLLFDPLPARGRSGSPLVNGKNQVIGVVTSSEGVAVRIDKIRELLWPEPPSPDGLANQQGKK